MKKKAIENIPYLTAGRRQEKKAYLAVAEVLQIAGEEHLLVEIYENRKGKLKVPALRLAYTKKDWGLYWTERDGVKARWSRAHCLNEFRDAVWETGAKRTGEKTAIADEDKGKIYAYIGKEESKWRNWVEELRCLEKDICYERRERREEKERLMLEQRHQDTPKLPEGFREWYEDTLFAGTDYLYYKRRGSYADFTCSHCGETYTEKIKRAESFEGKFEDVKETPQNGSVRRCGKCGRPGNCKPLGRAKNTYAITRPCYVIQKFRKQGAVVRYFEIEKTLRIGEAEKYEAVEITQNYFEPGKKEKAEYHLRNNWTGATFWNGVNLCRAPIGRKEGKMYPESIQELGRTYLRYSGLQEWQKWHPDIKAVEYLRAYVKHPYMEMAVKAGLDDMVEKMIEDRMGWMDLNETAKAPEDILRIRKERMKLLKDEKGELKLLKVLQIEKKENMHWSDSECRKLRTLKLSAEKLRTALKYMSLTQLLHRIQKYAGAEFGGCSTAEGRLSQMAGIYLDYLSMREELGYDMTNTVYLYPRDLSGAHRRMIEEVNKDKEDKRKRDKEEKYPEIRGNYRKIRRRYYYEDETYVIRPARSASEIIDEGRILHHCVGGDTYLRNHNLGERYILMMRFRDRPDLPYITVEIDAREERICQWYGENDKKPDEENVQKWLDAYVARLKRSRAAAGYILRTQRTA